MQKRSHMPFVLFRVLNNKTHGTVGSVITNPHSQVKNELTNCSRHCGNSNYANSSSYQKRNETKKCSGMNFWSYMEGKRDCCQFATENKKIPPSPLSPIYAQPYMPLYINWARRERVQIESISLLSKSILFQSISLISSHPVEIEHPLAFIIYKHDGRIWGQRFSEHRRETVTGWPCRKNSFSFLLLLGLLIFGALWSASKQRDPTGKEIGYSITVIVLLTLHKRALKQMSCTLLLHQG